jgi:hypothetical protein
MHMGKFTLLAFATFIAAAVGAAPTTQPVIGPSSQPTTKPVIDLQLLRAKVQDAVESLAIAHAAAVERTKVSENYKSAAAELVVRERALEQARAAGTPQEKLDASAAANRARQQLAKIQSAAIANDADARAAAHALAVAKADLIRAEHEAQSLADAERKDALDRKLRPVDWYLSHHNVSPEVAKAIRESRWLPGMDIEQQMLTNDGPGTYRVSFKHHWHSGGFGVAVGKQDVPGDPLGLGQDTAPDIEVRAKSRDGAIRAAQRRHDPDFWLADKATLIKSE